MSNTEQRKRHPSWKYHMFFHDDFVLGFFFFLGLLLYFLKNFYFPGRPPFALDCPRTLARISFSKTQTIGHVSFIRPHQVPTMNIGILGHVDSGKTTLAKALSEMGSTAAFDKHAKVADLRANTIDLGFSALTINDSKIALIDCPGHASLIKAVLAASSVFDAALVVINAARGIEPQTAEHLLIASILCPKHVAVVLNKVDLVTPEKVKSMVTKIPKLLESLGIDKKSPIVPVSLATPDETAIGAVAEAVEQIFYLPERDTEGDFVMSVDHCFPIKGKGTVMTGTVVKGRCKVGMEVEIPILNEKRKIKGIQSWKETISEASMGQRAALLFQNLSEACTSIDRTVLYEPGAMESTHLLLGTIHHISQFKWTLKNRAKIHLSVGFETVMAECQFLKEDGEEFELQDAFEPATTSRVLLELEKAVHTRPGAFFMAAKLDSTEKSCRFAFHGHIERVLKSRTDEPRIFHRKQRAGVLDRIENDRSIICSQLFKKETNFDVFNGMEVLLATGEVGRIEGSFGKGGKARIAIPGGLTGNLEAGKTEILLKMKKYLNEGDKGKLVAYL
uniref:Tr-type G domain-containing protein n=1 Tax=Steinernema glaseri TaxID=37863 RepID=A0A1I7Z5V7_9BILA